MDDIPQPCRIGRFTLEPGRGVLSGPEGEIRLRPKTCEVLVYLLRHSDRLVTRAELMEAVWGEVAVTDDSLTQCLVEIRRALGDLGREVVRTVPRRGYRLDGSFLSPGPASPGAPRARWRLPAAAIAILLAGAAAWLGFDRGLPPPPGSAPRTSIAVLPFVELSETGGQGHLGDGIAEEILNSLAQSGNLKVIARTSSFSFRDRPTDIRLIASQLGVDYLLEGSVRKSGDRFRVIAQLIDARDGAHVWSKDFDRELEDIFSIQDEIADGIARTLHVPEPPVDAQRNVVAYERYLRGRFLFHRRTPGDVDRAREHFRAAIGIDPGYAAAWAALAGTWIVQLTDQPPEAQPAFAEARRAAARALELDPRSVEGHLRTAMLAYAQGDDETGSRHTRIAEQLEPDNPLLLGLKAGEAMADGDLDTAIELQRRGLASDPLSILNRLNLAHVLLAAGTIEESRSLALTVAELSPENRREVDLVLTMALVLEERYAEAAALADGLPRREHTDVLLAIIGHELGRETESAAAMEKLRARNDWAGDLGIAEVYAHRGRRDEAWHWLEQSRRRLPSLLPGLAHDWRRSLWLSPYLRPLNADPRWATLVEALPPPVASIPAFAPSRGLAQDTPWPVIRGMSVWSASARLEGTSPACNRVSPSAARSPASGRPITCSRRKAASS